MAKRKGFMQRNQDTINFILAVLLLLGVVVVFSIVKIYFDADRGEILARVNGEPIFESELDRRMENLPAEMQQAYPKELVLEQLIQQKLLTQEIRNGMIRVSESEIEDARQEFMQANGLDEDTLEQILRIQGMSEADLKDSLKEQILLNKLLEQEAFSNLEVTDEEALEFYNSNADSFVIPETAEVQQLLVTTLNRSERQASLLAREIMDAAQEEGWHRLCEVTELSFDETACGKYNITQFTGLPDEFISAAFAMGVGEARIVKTVMGYHVMRKLDEVQEKLLRFEDVKDEIKERRISSKQSEAYNAYLAQLRKDAAIENYLADELAEEYIEQNPPEPTIDEKIQCMQERAVLYGARWDSQTKKQLEELGNNTFTYIDCALPDTLDEQRAVCDDAGITAYPTWVVNGQRHLGFQTLEQLEVITGC